MKPATPRNFGFDCFMINSEGGRQPEFKKAACSSTRRYADKERVVKRTPIHSRPWGDEPNATAYDLKQLAFAVLLFELVIAALTVATRAFFGVRTAVWVGLVIGAFVLVAFAVISLFGIFTHTIATFLARRASRARRDPQDGA